MDDRELEARLGERLHARFDAAPVPAGLVAVVRRQIDTTHGTKVRFAFRSRSWQLGWAVIAAVLVVSAALVFRNSLGPASPRTSSTPSATAAAATERWFVVLPREATLSK